MTHLTLYSAYTIKKASKSLLRVASEYLLDRREKLSFTVRREREKEREA
jgi:hypothetical protein